MSLFTKEDLRLRVKNEFSKGGITGDTIFTKATRLLSESKDQQREFSTKTYDIFLSDSSSDAALVAGLKLELEDLGYSVYVDWLEDPTLNRSNVDKATAKLLQERMKNCRSLFYAFTDNASHSKWMPWELGYFDGLKHKAAILPISDNYTDNYKGTEYLGLYYYITKDSIEGSKRQILWVHESSRVYVPYDSWVKSNLEPTKH